MTNHGLITKLEIRLRDRLRKNVIQFGRESDTLKYKKTKEQGQ